MEETTKTPQIALPKIIAIGDLLKSTWSVYLSNWKKFATILIIPLSLSFVVNLVLYFVENFGASLAWPWWILIGIFTAVIMVVFLVLYFMSYIAQFLLLKDLTQEVSFSNLKSWIAKARPYFWIVAGVSAVYSLFALIGFVLLIIPGIIFMVYYGFVIYFVIFEDKKFEGSFGLSRELVKNYWWAVFGRLVFGMLLIYVFYLIVGGILTLLAWLLSHFAHLNIDQNTGNLLYSFLSIFIGVVIGPVTVIYTYIIYKSLREIKK